MITTIKEYKLFEAKIKEKNVDVFCIDIDEKVIDEDYLENLNKFLKDIPRVYNINTNKPNNITFENEVQKLEKSNNRALDIDDVEYYFPKSMQQYVFDALTNIPDDNTVFDTIYSDKFIYTGKGNWLYIEKDFVSLFNNIKRLDRTVCLVGKKSSLKYFYTMLRSFDITVTFEREFIYDKPMVQITESIFNKNLTFKNLHLDSHHGQHDYTLKAYLDGNLAGYIDYVIYDEIVTISLIESFIKGKNIGPSMMKWLADEYGYENIERTNLTDSGAYLRKKMDDYYSFDYKKHKEDQIKHLDVSIIDQIKHRHPLLAEYMLDVYNNGLTKTWDKWLDRIQTGELNIPGNLDINDIFDITTWIKGSKTNDNSITSETPEPILTDLKELLK